MYIIGIAGGSGSGKSTFSDEIKKLYGSRVACLSCDSYYYPHPNMTLEERKGLNYDHPDALEIHLMLQHIRALKAGQSIDHPDYNFSTHNRRRKKVHLDPPEILIIDGILLYHFEELRALIDLKIYVETDADERILRRALRDMKKRRRKLEDIVEQYLKTVKPMHETYVEPTKKYADLILLGGRNATALHVIKAHLNHYLTGHSG